MVNKYKINNIKNIYYWLVIIFAIISTILISIGYSSYTSNLIINDFIVSIKPDKNVRITSTNIESTNNGANISNYSYGINQIYSDLYLPNENSEVTYLVQVKNFGNVEVGIREITINDIYKDILKIETTNYTEGSMIKDDAETCKNSVDGCKLDIVKSFYLTVKYQESGYDKASQINFTNLVINFTFEEMHRITYLLMDNINFPDEIFHGDDLSINIPSSPTNLTITGSDNYSYTDGNLTIYNIVNDISIVDPQAASKEYHITYTGLSSEETIEYPTTISRGSSFTIKYSKVYSAEVIGSEDYFNDIQNGILTVNNVIGDIEIIFTKIHDVDYAIEVDENTNTATLSLDSSKVDSTTGTNITELFSSGNKMTGVNLTNKKISSIKVEIDYTGPGKGPNLLFDCILNATDNVDSNNNITNKTNRVTLNKGYTTKTTISTIFEGLNLNPDSTFTISNTINTAGKAGFKIYRFDIIVTLEDITN